MEEVRELRPIIKHITPGDVPPIEVVERTPKGRAWSKLPDGFVRIQRADGETWVFYYRTRNDIFPAAMMLAPGTANLRG